MPTSATNRFQKIVDKISSLYTNARKAQVQFAWAAGIFKEALRCVEMWQTKVVK